jgi:hypothetical protein
MDNLGSIIGIAVAIALGAYFRKAYPSATRTARFAQTSVVLIVVVVTAAAGSVGGNYLRKVTGSPTTKDIDRNIQATKELPLLGLVMAEYPEIEGRVRAAIEADLKSPNTSGPKATNMLGAELREQYVLPVLRNADNTSALSAVAALQQLLQHLQRSDVALCQEMGVRGLQNPSALDTEGRRLFKQALSFQEAAYRSGKTPRSSKPLQDDEVAPLLEKAGYTNSDIEQLSKLDTLAPSEACMASVKLYSAPGRLPATLGGPLAKWLLTIAS